MITRFPIRLPYRIPFGSVAHRSDLTSAIVRSGSASRGRSPIAHCSRQAWRISASVDAGFVARRDAADWIARCALSSRPLMLCPKRRENSPRRGGTGPKNTMRFTLAGCASAYDAASSGPYEWATSVTLAEPEVLSQLVEVLHLTRGNERRRVRGQRRLPAAALIVEDHRVLLRRGRRSRWRSTRGPFRGRRGSR